jgi:hypothetical protein
MKANVCFIVAQGYKLAIKAVAPCLWLSVEHNNLNRDDNSIINCRLKQDVINITEHQILNFDRFVAKVSKHCIILLLPL